MRRAMLVAATLVVGCSDGDKNRFDVTPEMRAQINRSNAEAAEAKIARTAAAENEKRALYAEADAAQEKRINQLGKDTFPAYPKNAIHDCAMKKMAPLEVGFGFNTDLALAYKLHFSDEALAQRFVKYVRAAADCTAYGHSDLERALIPALDSVATPQALGTIIAVAGDACARKAQNTPECLSSAAQAFLDIGNMGRR